MSRRPLPNALDLDLRGDLTDAATPHAGVALLIDLRRRSGVILAADRHLPPKKSAAPASRAPRGWRPCATSGCPCCGPAFWPAG
jgi:hypothetical protein